jgi:diamine N-acetyltransferase
MDGMNHDLKFREAFSRDIPMLLEYMRKFYALDHYPFDEAKARHNLNKFIFTPELGRMWVLEIDQKPIGYLALTFGFSFEYDGRDAFIDEIYLDDEYRGKGYGTKVMQMLEERARQLDVHAMHLEVERTNRRGEKLYINSGFSSNDRRLLTKRL